MTNCTAIAAIRSPITRPTARVPARPSRRKIRSALCNKMYVARTDTRIPANTNSLSSGAVAEDDIKIMTVVIAPGPAKRGMPSGTTATSSRSSVSSRSCCVRRVRDRSPRNISNATPKRTMPPAMRNAGIVNPKPAKIHWPNTAKTPSVIVAVRHAFEMMFCFWALSMSSVRTEKNGTTPSGSTMAKIEAMAVAPNAKSTMVVPETDSGLVSSHQLHPAAALVHGEIAAAGGPFELIPGDDLELLAAALREPQRVRASNLARLEALHRGDLPRVLERDLLECRHVPSLRNATVWRRADGCTTMML